MEHFSERGWADFARGLTAAENLEGIKAHIAAGCIQCTTATRFWNRVQTMAQAERSYMAPENMVRMAKLEFTAKQEFQAENWTLADVLFDNFSGALAHGVRSGGAVARQMVYEAEDLTIDLRFDCAGFPHKVSAVGQILDNRTPREQMTGAPIVLWTEHGQLVGTTTANYYGEFQLEFEAQDDLRLTARVGRRRVRIPLVNLK